MNDLALIEPEAPKSLEIEQAFIGALLRNNDVLSTVRCPLEPEHFFEPVHGRLFAACAARIRKDLGVDPAILRNQFEHDEGFEDVGGFSYVIRMVASVPSLVSAADYAQTIYDHYRRRTLMQLADGLNLNALSYDTDIETTIEDANNQLSDLRITDKRFGFKTIYENAEKSIVMIDSARSSGVMSGLLTGISDLDEMIGGLEAQEVMIIGARPSIGKTVLISNIGVNIAEKKGVIFFSMEQSGEQIARRLLSERSKQRVKYSKARRGEIGEKELYSLINAKNTFEKVPLYICDRSSMGIGAIESETRRRIRVMRRLGVEPGCILLDHIHRITKPRGMGDVEHFTEVGVWLKDMAKMFDVPMIAACQLSRNVESRPDKRPILSDLKYSSALEENADCVLFLYRQHYYESRKSGVDSDRLKDIELEMEIDAAKVREGPTGMRMFQFDGAVNRIRNLPQTELEGF